MRNNHINQVSVNVHFNIVWVETMKIVVHYMRIFE